MASEEQMKKLLDFLEANPELAKNQSSSGLERSMMLRLWTECSTILNQVSTNGPAKTPWQWRMFFYDYKSKFLRQLGTLEQGATGREQAKHNLFTPDVKRLCHILGIHVEEVLSEDMIEENTPICLDPSPEPLLDDQATTKSEDTVLNNNKRKLSETDEDLQNESSKKCNPFGLYVGEQLETLMPHQRQIAEKLISDVIFLAKTENLSFYSKIETHMQLHSALSPGSSPKTVVLPSYASQITAQSPQSGMCNLPFLLPNQAQSQLTLPTFLTKKKSVSKTIETHPNQIPKIKLRQFSSQHISSMPFINKIVRNSKQNPPPWHRPAKAS